MCDADELQEGVARRDVPRERRGIEGSAENRPRPVGQLLLRAGTDERADGVSARDELRNDAAADGAGAACDEDVHGCSTREA